MELTNLEKDNLNDFEQTGAGPNPVLVSTAESATDRTGFIATSILAKDFGYDPIHIARLARLGKVKSFKEGKKWFVERTSLEEYKTNAEANRRAVAFATIKVFKKEPVAVSPNRDILTDITAVLTSYLGRQEEISRQRVEYFNKFVSEVKDIFKEVGMHFERGVDSVVGFQIPLPDVRAELAAYFERQKEYTKVREENLSKFFSFTGGVIGELCSNFVSNCGLIAGYKLPVLNVSAILADYAEREREQSKFHLELAGKFCAPLVEIYGDFTTGFGRCVQNAANILSLRVESPSFAFPEVTNVSFLRKLVPSIDLFQIAEQNRAVRVGSSPSKFDGFKPVLPALFIFVFGFSMLSTVLSNPMLGANLYEGAKLFDDQTGQPYCVRISGGNVITKKGSCSDYSPGPGSISYNTRLGG